jgi:hypothetical protein
MMHSSNTHAARRASRGRVTNAVPRQHFTPAARSMVGAVRRFFRLHGSRADDGAPAVQ